MFSGVKLAYRTHGPQVQSSLQTFNDDISGPKQSEIQYAVIVTLQTERSLILNNNYSYFIFTIFTIFRKKATQALHVAAYVKLY